MNSGVLPKASCIPGEKSDSEGGDEKNEDEEEGIVDDDEDEKRDGEASEKDRDKDTNNGSRHRAAVGASTSGGGGGRGEVVHGTVTTQRAEWWGFLGMCELGFVPTWIISKAKKAKPCVSPTASLYINFF